jgi:hypothetical protein
MVDEADISSGIYAWRYGHIPAGHDISITDIARFYGLLDDAKETYLEKHRLR